MSFTWATKNQLVGFSKASPEGKCKHSTSLLKVVSNLPTGLYQYCDSFIKSLHVFVGISFSSPIRSNIAIITWTAWTAFCTFHSFWCHISTRTKYYNDANSWFSSNSFLFVSLTTSFVQSIKGRYCCYQFDSVFSYCILSIIHCFIKFLHFWIFCNIRLKNVHSRPWV